MKFAKIKIENKKLRKAVSQAAYFLAGNLLYALALNLFFIENNIAAGGFAGIATIINYVVPIHVGLFVFIMNVPFLIWAGLSKGWSYTAKTLLGSVVYSGMVDLLSFLPTITDNLLAASIFGGVLYGVGAVALLKANASCGGTDLVARLIKFRGISLGRMFLIVDGFTILLAITVYKDLELAVYAMTALFVCSVCTDRIIAGFNDANLCYIITEKDPRIMADAIFHRLHRTATLQKGTGLYKNTDKNILLAVVRPREIYILKDLISEFDKKAFVIEVHAKEVHGGGFQEEGGRYENSANRSLEVSDIRP
ncbi:MAG: YitT family protein [Clostridiales bacterium]|nr:YitT family protein [Clostridiales bacterium]